jgi:hypothetical protein
MTFICSHFRLRIQELQPVSDCRLILFSNILMVYFLGFNLSTSNLWGARWDCQSAPNFCNYQMVADIIISLSNIGCQVYLNAMFCLSWHNQFGCGSFHQVWSWYIYECCDEGTLYFWQLCFYMYIPVTAQCHSSHILRPVNGRSPTWTSNSLITVFKSSVLYRVPRFKPHV